MACGPSAKSSSPSAATFCLRRELVRFVRAARVVLLRPTNRPKHSLGPWLEAAAKADASQVVATALANKLTRMPGACCTTVADTSIRMRVLSSPEELTTTVIKSRRGLREEQKMGNSLAGASSVIW